MIKFVPNIEIPIDANLCRGAFRLWFEVLVRSIRELKANGYSRGAEEFLFDDGNQFFIGLCDELDTEPERMRQRIRQALKKR